MVFNVNKQWVLHNFDRVFMLNKYDHYSAIHKAAGSLASGRSQNSHQSEPPPKGVPAGGSHSQPMGHFSVEQWNCTSQIMEWPGTVRPAAL